MSTSQSIEDEVDESFRVGGPIPPPPPAPPVGHVSEHRRSDDPPPPPVAPPSPPSPPSVFGSTGPSGPPPPPPNADVQVSQRRRTEDLDETEDSLDEAEADRAAPANAGPGSTNYELDLLERKADHTAARLGAHRSQLDTIRTGSASRFRSEFQQYVDGNRRSADSDTAPDEGPIRFPTPNKISTEHADLLRAAALMVRSGWVSPKLLEELDQLQAELHEGVCQLRQERSYARRRHLDGSPEMERQVERLSERVHAPRLERVERRARRVLSRTSVPGDFETLAKEYRRDFTDYSATLADIVAEVGGPDQVQ